MGAEARLCLLVLIVCILQTIRHGYAIIYANEPLQDLINESDQYCCHPHDNLHLKWLVLFEVKSAEFRMNRLQLFVIGLIVIWLFYPI